MRSWGQWSLALCAVVWLVCGCAPHIPAPARLVFASPAPETIVGALPQTLKLHFSEALLPDGSSAGLVDPGGQPMNASVTVSADDAQTLELHVAQQGNGGRFTVNWQTVSAESRSPASGAFAFTVDTGAPVHPQLAVSPSLTDVGKPVTVSGSGFAPGATISLTVADDDEPLGSTQADASGAFTATETMPGDVPLGNQPIWAADQVGTRAATAVEVRWGGWPPLRVYTQAEPGPESGQVTFTVVGRNRSDYVLDGVRVSLEIPAGATLVSASEDAQIASGTVTWDQGVLDRTTLVPRRAVVSAADAVVGRATVDFRHRRASGCIGDQCLPAFVDQTQSMSGPAVPAP